jgi:hypothetical protein
LVALAFALSTFERWLARRRRHELAWTVALAFFSLAAFSLAAGAALGWSPATFRLFYLFGAIVNVPFLALGTIYLLFGDRFGDRVAAGVALFSAFAAGVVVSAPLVGRVPVDSLAQGSDVFGPLPRIFAGVSSGLGALVIFAGAVWSAYRYRRGRMLFANLLIAAGTVVLSASGLLNSVLDEMDGFAISLVAGISVIFAGFLVAGTGRPSNRASEAEPEPARPAGLRAVPTDGAASSATASAAGGEAASRPSRAATPRRT